MDRRFLSEKYSGSPDDSYVTTSNIAQVYSSFKSGDTGIKKLISSQTSEEIPEISDKTLGIKKPSSGKALKSFESFLEELDDNAANVEAIRKELLFMDFKKTAKYLNKKISERYKTHEKTQDIVSSFVSSFEKEYVTLCDETRINFYSLFAQLMDFSFGENKKENPDENLLIIDKAQNYFKKIKEIMEYGEEWSYIEGFFERLKRFTTGDIRSLYSDSDNESNSNHLINSIMTAFDKTLNGLINKISSINYLEIDGVFECSTYIFQKAKKLEEEFCEEEDLKETKEAYEKLSAICEKAEGMYFDNLGADKVKKLQIFLGFEKLFSEYAENPNLKKADEVSRLIALIDPENNGSSQIMGASLPSTFIKESEVRAIRLLFASMFAKIDNPGENFKIEEFNCLTDLYENIYFHEQLLATMTNQFIRELKSERFEDKTDVSDLLFKIIMDLEYGLVVRDISTGFDLSYFEVERYREGDKWFYRKKADNFNPNYSPELKAHSLFQENGGFDRELSVYRKQKIDSYDNSKTISEYQKVFLNAPDDDLEDISDTVSDDLTNSMFQAEDLNNLVSQLKRDISYASQSIDKKYQILDLIKKVGELFEKKKDEISSDDLSNVFSVLEDLYACYEQFTRPEINSIKFYLIHKYLGIKSAGLVSEWQYDLFFMLNELRKKYEEVLSTLLPYIDDLEKYLKTGRFEALVSAPVVNQLRLSEWEISPRKLACEKETYPDEWLITFNEEGEKYREALVNKAVEILIIDEEIEAEKAYEKELQRQLEEYSNDYGVERSYNPIFAIKVLKPAVISALILAVAVGVANVYKMNEQEDLFSDSDGEIFFESKEIPEKSDMIEKYENGDLVFMNADKNDSFGYKILSKYWEGISGIDEARDYFESLSRDAKTSVNVQMKSFIESTISKSIKNDADLLIAKAEIEAIIGK